MATRLFYIDESHDDLKFCLCALSLRVDEWKLAFDQVRAHRQQLKHHHGMLIRTEVHARDLVAGRGRLGPKQVVKWERSRIFLGLLRLVASLPNMRVINVCLETKGHRDPQLDAWDRLLNRVERNLDADERREAPFHAFLSEKVLSVVPNKLADIMRSRLRPYSARGILVADEGREGEITRAKRKMHVHNPIPSKFGHWASGQSSKHIPTNRIVEDPVFKDSAHSYFLQLADCVAFALLKSEVPQTPLIQRYGIHEMFEAALAPVCVKQAHAADPRKLGIVRR